MKPGTPCTRRLFVSSLGLAAGALALPRPLLAAPRSLPLFTSREIEAQADELALDLGIDVGKRQFVARRLRKLLWSSRFQQILKSPGVTGVAAFRGGGGGLLVRYTKVRGFVAYKDEQPATPFEMGFTSFGAHLGGSGEWGVMLIEGLRDADGFGGKYRAKVTSATAAEASTATSTMYRHDVLDSRHVHDVHIVGASEGLSVDAGGGVVRIRVLERDQPEPGSDVDAELKVSANPNGRS